VLHVNFEVAKGPRVDQSLFLMREVTLLGQERYFGDAFIVCVLQHIRRWRRQTVLQKRLEMVCAVDGRTRDVSSGGGSGNLASWRSGFGDATDRTVPDAGVLTAEIQR